MDLTKVKWGKDGPPVSGQKMTDEQFNIWIVARDKEINKNNRNNKIFGVFMVFLFAITFLCAGFAMGLGKLCR